MKKVIKSWQGIVLVLAVFVALGICDKVQAANGPILTAFSATPLLVDTTSSSQTVTATFSVSSSSGLDINRSECSLKSVNTGRNRYGDIVDNGNNQYTCEVTIPALSAKGQWHFQLWFSDSLQNTTDYYGDGIPTAVPEAQWTVENTASIEDITPPELTAFSAAPATIDTSSEAQAVTATITATDMSGVQLDPGGDGSICQLINDSGAYVMRSQQGVFVSDDGNRYTCAVILPAGSATGNWHFRLALYDNLGQNIYYETAAEILEKVPDATGMTVTNGNGTAPTLIPIATAAIAGIVVPVAGATPTASIVDTDEYTATIRWDGNPTTFAPNTAYTAIINITPKAGYTLSGVPENFFTVVGATTTNATGSGVVMAVFPVTAPVQTNICGTISTDTRWGTGGSPYMVTCSIAISQGATLTIESGVIVRFNQGTFLQVNGTLSSEGTESQPITFTSSDGARSWDGISIASDGAASLDHVVIEKTKKRPSYTTWGYYPPDTPALSILSSNVTLKNSVVRDNDLGINVSTNVTIENVEVSNIGDYGIAVSGTAAPTINNVQISHSGVGINVNDYTAPVINGVSVSDGGTGINIGYLATPVINNADLNNNSGNAIYSQGSADIEHIQGTATNNGFNGIVVYGGIYGGESSISRTWDGVTSGMPILVGGRDSFNIPQGATLTIKPGTIVYFVLDSYMVVNGTLRAEGTDSQPITLTSRDGVQSWNGVNIASDGAASLDHVVIEKTKKRLSYVAYWDQHYYSDTPALSILSNNITLKNSVIRDSNLGINVSTNVTIENVEVSNIGDYGIAVSGTAAPTINNVQISHSGVGINVNDYTAPVINGVSVSDGGTGINIGYLATPVINNADLNNNSGNAIYSQGSADIEHVQGTATGNGFNGIVVYGGLNVSRTWDGPTSGMPILVQNGYSIPLGTTLTIKPGTTIQFMHNGYSGQVILQINGTLTANGTESQPITFTSSDGTRSWNGINIASDGAASLDHVVIEKTMKRPYGVNWWDQGYFLDTPALNILSSNVTLKNSVIRDNDLGINVSTNVTIENVEVSNIGDYGIAVSGTAGQYGYESSTAPSITNVNISHCGVGINVNDYTAPIINGLSVSDGGRGINIGYLAAPVVNDAIINNNSGNAIDANGTADIENIHTSIANNGFDGMTISGGLSISRTWNGQTLGMPILIQANYVFNIPSGATLTIKPGTTVQFAKDLSMQVNGTLNANGTKSQPITFTSRDGNRSWRGIFITDNGSADLNLIVIENVNKRPSYSEWGYYSIDTPALSILSGNVVLKNSVVRNNDQGIYAATNNENVKIENNDIYNNTDYGMSYIGSGTLDTQNNYWGNASGTAGIRIDNGIHDGFGEKTNGNVGVSHYSSNPNTCPSLMDASGMPIVSSKKNLVAITHGYDGKGTDQWIKDMISYIKLKSSNDTTVAYYDWQEGADKTSDKGFDILNGAGALQFPPSNAYINAFYYGDCLAQQIKAAHPSGNIHLIAHSVGSNVIQTAVDIFHEKNTFAGWPESPSIQLTFLDAYAPSDYDLRLAKNPIGTAINTYLDIVGRDYPGILVDLKDLLSHPADSRYGDLHNFLGYAEQYVDSAISSAAYDLSNMESADFPDTNIMLHKAVNFDVTYLTNKAGRSHVWPVKFYNASVISPQYANYFYKLGFPFSSEGRDYINRPDESFRDRWCVVTDISDPYSNCQKYYTVYPTDNGAFVDTVGSAVIDLTNLFGIHDPTDDFNGLIPPITMETNEAKVDISEGTNVVNAPSGWDEKIHSPEVVTDVPNSATFVDFRAFSVGSSDVHLVFNKAVKITVPSKSMDYVAYIDSSRNNYTIMKTCLDDQKDGSNISDGGDCWFNGDDGNLVIWTKHFTTFVTYTLRDMSDTTPPTTTLSISGDGGPDWFRSDVQVTLSATDNDGGSGVDRTEYSLDGGATWLAYNNPFMISGEGTHEVKYRSTDKAGNVENAKTAEIKIDETAPVTTVNVSGTQGNSDWFKKDDVKVKLSATDSASGVAKTEYRLDNDQTWNGYDASKGITISNDGTTEVEYYSVDNAGNAETAKTQEVKLDKTPPEITISVPKSDNTGVYVLNLKVNADWSATDELSGIDSATGTIDSGSPIGTSSVGSKDFTVTATDKAGNATEETVKYDVIYSFGGFQSPAAKDNKTFNGNSTIPVNFQLTDSNGKYISDATARLEVDDKEAVASGSSNDGNKFKYDASTDQYIFNLSLKNTSLDSGTHTIKIVLDDGTIHPLDITVK